MAARANPLIVMKKIAILTVFIALLFGRPNVAENQQRTPHAANDKSGEQSEPAKAPDTVTYAEDCCKTEPANAKNEPEEKPLPRFVRPEWVIVYVTIVYAIIAGFTLGAIRGQAKTMDTQATAALKQANHIAASERAWMIAEMGAPAFITSKGKTSFRIAPQLRNKGKTPAFILESASAAIVLKKEESLPKIPTPYPRVAKWDGHGAPLAPRGEVGGDIVCEFEDTGKILSGEMVLWVYGYVRYNDVFLTEIRQTKYCFRWERSMMNGNSSPYSIDGPEGYNEAT